MEDTDARIRHLYQDLTASLLAITNALAAKGVVTKQEIAHAATERLLVLKELLPAEETHSLVLLQALSTSFERVPGD
ncbi:MAG: hypothetical protein ACK51V_02605 [bacterium]|jgi:hypothetical protein